MSKRRKVGQRRGHLRSTSRYRHPVPDPRVIVQALEDQGIPVSFETLVDLLRVTGDQPLKALRRHLQRMAANGRLLINRKTCVCGEIVDQLPLAQSTVSQHLKILKESGLIQGELDGPKVCYCINREKLKELKAFIAGL